MTKTANERFWIIETTDSTFENDVLVRSQLGLVVVDFWAQWCAPCRMLGPILEKLADEFGGRFTLVKANTDQAQVAASQFGVSGIPALFAVSDGQIVDQLQGLVPEESLRDWLEQLIRSVSLLEVERLADSMPEKAEEKLQGILAQAPNDPAALNMQAELLLRRGELEQCRTIIESLEQRGFLEPKAEKVKAALDLRSKSGADVESLRAAATASPKDFEKQFALAEALAGQQQYADAFEICLTLIAVDRKRSGEKARQLMVDVFRALPDDSELTREYRRKLSMALY